MEALKVESVSKDFGGVRALNDVSFRVELGERLAIVGPNGAGKTTLLNVLNGQQRVTSGRVYLFGTDITDTPIHRRAHSGIGRSFQITNLFPNLTALDSMLLALHGVRPSRLNVWRSNKAYPSLFAKARELLEPMQLWEKRHERVKAMSYGEQRKLEIALGLASKPKLLLMDEPSAGLTRAESAEVASIIRNLGPDIAVIVVDHDMDLVFDVADKIVVMHYGEIISEGHPDVIRGDPRLKEIYMGTEESWSDVRPT